MALHRTPFTTHHEASGARLVPFAGFEMPVQYSGLRAEHLATRSAAGLFDVSHMGEIRVRGPRAEDFLQRLCSNAIRRLQPGRAQYNAVCNERGGVVDDVFVYRLAADDFLVCVNAANRAKDFDWFVAHNDAGADITDEGDQWAQIAVQGPRAVSIVDRLASVEAAAMARHDVVVASFAGVERCILARTGYTGEDGFEVFLPADEAGPAWPAVLEAGASDGIVPVGLGARDTLRLEVRNCLYGHELNDDISPLSAGLGWIVKLKKPGGFIGSEAIARRQESDDAQLVGLVMEGKRIPREGMDLRLDDRTVGRITSGTKSPCTGHGVALGFVNRDLAKVDQRLAVDVRGRSELARVVSGSFLNLEAKEAP